MGRKGLTLLELLIVAAIVGVVILALSPMIESTRERARRYMCANNLRRIILALHSYALDNEGRFPEDMSLLYPKYVGDVKTFICPSDVDASYIAQNGLDIDAASSYLYARGWSEKDPLDTILICDKNDIFGKDTNHDGEGGNLAYLKGEVKWTDTPDWVDPVDKE